MSAAEFVALVLWVRRAALLCLLEGDTVGADRWMARLAALEAP